MGLNPRTFDPSRLTPEQFQEIFKCRKRFPRNLTPDDMGGELCAHPVANQAGNVTYNPPRDDGYINNYHPVYLHAWGANTDMQVLHKTSMLL